VRKEFRWPGLGGEGAQLAGAGRGGGNPERGWVAEEMDLEHGHWGDNSGGGTIHMGTILGREGTHRGVTVGVVITVVIITVEESDIGSHSGGGVFYHSN